MYLISARLPLASGFQPHLVEQRLGLFHRELVALHLGVVEAGLRRDRTGRDLGVAEIDALVERVAVDQMHHCLPEPLVVHWCDAIVHLEPLMRREILIALGGVFEILLRLEALDVEELDVGPLHELHCTVLKRQRPRGAIRDDAVDDLVEIGLILAVVAVVPHQMDMRAAHPFLQLEGTGADRLVVHRVLAEVGAFVDVLGHDRGGGAIEATEEGRERLFQLEDDGQRIGRLGGRDAREILACARMGLRQHLHAAEDNVLGRHRLAVVEGDAREELERVGEAVRRDLPRLRHARHRLQIGAVFQQAFVDLAAQRQGRLLLVERRHEDRRFGLDDRVERTALRLTGCSGDAERDGRTGGQHCSSEFAPVHGPTP